MPIFGNSLWASSFGLNARDGADSQVLRVKLIFAFSVTFGTKSMRLVCGKRTISIV